LDPSSYIRILEDLGTSFPMPGGGEVTLLFLYSSIYLV